MIERLRRRLTLLVTGVLILVTAGIIFSINYVNWRQITGQARKALELLAENKGSRPSPKKDNPQFEPGKEPSRGGQSMPGRPPGLPETIAGMSSYYTVTLTADGEVSGWTSERSDLYTDEQVEDFAGYFFKSLIACTPAYLCTFLELPHIVSILFGLITGPALYWLMLRKNEDMLELISLARNAIHKKGNKDAKTQED